MPEAVTGANLPRIKVEKNYTVQVYLRYARALAFAQPLADGGVEIFGYYERISRTLHRRPVPGKFHQFYFILQGSLEYECGNKHLIASRQQIMLLPSNCSYKRLKMSKSLRYLYFCVTPTPDWNSLTTIGPYIRDFQDCDLMLSLTSKVLNQVREKTLKRRRECIEYSKMILSILQMERVQSSKAKSEEARVRELARLVRQDLSKKWSLKEMAGLIKVSPSTLNRLCRKYYHDSVINMVIKLRIERSVELLISNEDSIARISNMVGYSSSAVFSNHFLKHTGVRPGAFRKNHQGINREGLSIFED